MLLLATAGMFAAYSWSKGNGLEQLDDVAFRQLDLFASTLENELGKYAYLPSLIEIDQQVISLFEHPADVLEKVAVSRKLASINVRAGSVTIFLTSTDGTVLASSDWYKAGTTLGQRLATLPFFAQALTGEKSHFFAANAVGGAPEYYLTQPFLRDNRIIGFIGVKVSLVPLEATWVDLGIRSESEKIMVIDDYDVVIMSSVPQWKYKTMTSITPARRHALLTLGKYPPIALEPLPIIFEKTIERGAKLVRFPESAGGPAALRVAQESSMPLLGWRLMIISDPSEVWRNARLAAWGGGAITAFFCLLALYLLQRRRALMQLFLARNALQQANDKLEMEVAQRTSELRETNHELVREIQERHLAEEELIQAGKLAAIGQMSAGVSHEINQPLTALRALSRNATTFLRKGRIADAVASLQAISDVAERMGRITAQLKSFARKAHITKGPVFLTTAIGNVQLLLEHRLRAEHVEVRIDVPERSPVNCDGNRLEQVLINLATNALDAMALASTKVLCISARPRNGRMFVCVADAGPDIPDEVLRRFFEPFYSTKPAGEGLGLGLVISSNIVREFGSALRVRKGDVGLVFEFDVELAQGDGNV